MKNTKKTANKLPVPGKVKKGFRFYCAAVLSVALVLGCSVTAFAANDPIAVVNRRSADGGQQPVRFYFLADPRHWPHPAGLRYFAGGPVSQEP